MIRQIRFDAFGANCVGHQSLGVDGFNPGYAAMRETFAHIAERLAPELRRRGLSCARGLLAAPGETLFGGGGRLPKTHSGARRRCLEEAAE